MLLHLVQGIWQFLQILLRFAVPQMLSPGESPTWQKQPDSQSLLFWATTEFPRLCIHYWSRFIALLQRRRYCPNSRAGKSKAPKLSHFPMNAQLGSGFQSSFGWLQGSRLCSPSFLFSVHLPSSLLQVLICTNCSSKHLFKIVNSRGYTEKEVVMLHDNPGERCMPQSHLWVIKDRKAENWWPSVTCKELLLPPTVIQDPRPPQMLMCKRSLDASVHLSAICHCIVTVWSTSPAFLLYSGHRPWRWNREWITYSAWLHGPSS